MRNPAHSCQLPVSCVATFSAICAYSSALPILYSAVITAIIAFALEKTIGWRVTEAQEVGGIDLADQGERAYDFMMRMERKAC